MIKIREALLKLSEEICFIKRLFNSLLKLSEEIFLIKKSRLDGRLRSQRKEKEIKL